MPVERDVKTFAGLAGRRVTVGTLSQAREHFSMTRMREPKWPTLGVVSASLREGLPSRMRL